MARYFTYEKRKDIEVMLKEGFSVTRIAKELNISRGGMLNELQKGLKDYELKDRRYVKYIPEKAVKRDIEKVFGEDGLKAVIEYINNHKEDNDD